MNSLILNTTLYPPANTTKSLDEIYKTEGLYAYFAAAGFLPPVVALLSGKAFLALLGIVMNVDLAWVTYKSKNLHGSCNILIALSAVSSAVYELSFLITFGVVVSGKNVIPYMTCVYLQLAPAFAKYFTLCLMVFIGLDRLKSIVLPTWNYPSTHFFYTYIGVVCCAGYCAFLIGLTLQVALQMPPTWFGQPITAVCSATEISKWYAGTWVVTSALVLNMTSACVYLLIFVMLRTYKVAKNLEKTERIYKSLCVIVAIEVIGWGSNSLTQHLSSLGLFYWYGDAYTVWCFEQALSYLLVMATTVNAPVLITFSVTYRKAFIAQLRSFRKWRNSTHNSVQMYHVDNRLRRG